MADFRNLRVWQKANALSVATAEALDGVRGHAGVILRGQLLRITSSCFAISELSMTPFLSRSIPAWIKSAKC
jgi:hypothetical protein